MKADPTVPGVQLEMAMALQRLGRQQEAVTWFQQAVEREPKNVMALTNLGLALTLTGKGKEALEYLKRALAENAKDPVIYKDLGVCHIQLSAFDEAIEDFKKALALIRPILSFTTILGWHTSSKTGRMRRLRS